jgi:glycine betaine/proline transport system permease protein
VISPGDILSIPLADWVDSFVKDWLAPNFRPFFHALRLPIQSVLNGLNDLLDAIPVLFFAGGLAMVAWITAGLGVAIFTIVSLVFIDMIGLWPETMTTFAMVVTAVLFCVVVGIPIGILASRSDRFMSILRPILDIMQTIPSFVYLVPIVMLFGIGTVPGVIATIIFALPPVVRLTNLGIRNVREDLVEAANAFGASAWQTLWEVQLPLAMRTIMAGINQTLMLALSMVVIAALIGAGGLGFTVNTGLGRLDVGMATAGGVGIVLIAIILDRITQALGEGGTAQGHTFVKTLVSIFRFRGTKESTERAS